MWESAERAVVSPADRDQVVTLGAELSLWNPLLRHWLIWMRRECPSVGVSTKIDSAERLIEQVQDGSLDVAVVYGSTWRPGLITELLFEERLILVRTTPIGEQFEAADRVQVHWGDDFEASYWAAFPDEPRPMVSISYGPLALDYILAVGGSGYFREGFVKPYLDQGLVAPVADSPEFSYCASLVHSTRADEGMIDTIRTGLRIAAALSA